MQSTRQALDGQIAQEDFVRRKPTQTLLKPLKDAKTPVPQLNQDLLPQGLIPIRRLQQLSPRFGGGFFLATCCWELASAPDQGLQRLGDVVLAHQGFAHQYGIGSGALDAVEILATKETRFTDQQAALGAQLLAIALHQLLGCRKIGVERGEVAIVDADQLNAIEGQHPLEFSRVMHLDQGRQPEALGDLEQITEVLIGEDRRDQ